MRKTKRDYIKQLSDKIVSENRKSCKTTGPLFSEKTFQKDTITSKDNNRTITNNQELAETFNTSLRNVTQNLKVDNNLVEITQKLDSSDPV